MKNFISLPGPEKKVYFDKAAAKLNLRTEFIEKDFWVSWTLGMLFSDPDLGGSIIFKGGTTLSKAYGIIKRFSEDIDISIDRQVLLAQGNH